MMNLRIIRAIVKKDLIDVLKHKSLAMVMVGPLFIAAIYLILNLATQSPTQVLVYNPDNVPLSDTLRLVVPRIRVDNATNADEVRSKLADANSPYQYGLVIPAGTIAAMKAGQHPQLAIYINGQKAKDFYAQQGASQSFFAYFQAKSGQVPPYEPVSVVFNPDPHSATDYIELARQNGALFAAMALAIVPIAVGIHILPGLMVEEKEKKTIRLLLTSPGRALDIVIAKSIVSFFYTLVISLLITLTFLGNIADFTSLFVFIVLGNLFACALGILFGVFFNDIQTLYAWVGGVALVLMVPIFFAMPFLAEVPVLSQVVYAIPSFYITKGLLGASIGDLSFGLMSLYAALLAAFTVAAFIIAAWVLRRRTIFA
jgi:ABC-2 type transport system permease protein